MTIFSSLSSRVSVGAVAVTIGLVLAAPAVDAKAGGGFSSGSRGGRTFSAPSATTTAPGSAQPFQRTQTAPSPASPGYAAPAAQPRRFGGFGTGLMAGVLGAGLFGMLGGHGFLGGLDGLSSLFGLVFQLALIGGLVWLALRFFRSRSQPALAGPGMSGMGMARSGLDPTGGRPGSVPLGGGNGPAQPDQVGIGPSDYTAFEGTLVELQTAYSREDLAALSRIATPELVGYLGTDIGENRNRNLRNDVKEPKLLQGDLAEAWREGPTEYATVAMRFSVVDTMVDRVTGRVVQGDPVRPEESTELWTFRRDNRGPWILSAVQQTR